MNKNYVNTLHNLDKIQKLLRRHKLTKFAHEEIDNLNTPIS